ncbi:LysR family transcriptional regulator [Sphingobacterium arenae]|nr:LysR family transcriptional regulator [Sphingobacterium arenae]
MINVDFKILVFISAAKHLNFTRAAKEMNISQPAVSKNIKELEAQAGRSLFERTGQRIRLNEAGRLFFEYAMRLVNVYETLNGELGLLDGILLGELRLGASNTLSHYILPNILADFHIAFSTISLKVLHGNSRMIEELLLDRTIDLGVTEGLSDNPSMKYETFIKDEVVLVTRSGNPKLEQVDSLHPQKLLELEYVLREDGSGTNEIIRKALTTVDIDWHALYVKVYLASTESIKSFLSKTDCFSFLSIHAITAELQNGTLQIVEVDGLTIDRNFYFVRPHGVIGHLPETFRKFAYERFVKNGLFHSEGNVL